MFAYVIEYSFNMFKIRNIVLHCHEFQNKNFAKIKLTYNSCPLSSDHQIGKKLILF